MYNLLLVDDEVLIADGMYDALCELNMENLYPIKAYSVQEALEAAENRRIDILLTDINMPDMDGFALYERIVKNWPYCRVIFLTGFETFDYAYKAIQYKNVRYIIKAEGVDKVLDTVGEAVGDLEAELETKLPAVFDLARESRERLLKEILLGYFNGEIQERELREENLSQLGFCIDLDRPICLVGAKLDRKKRQILYQERLALVKDMNLMLKGHLKEHFKMVPIDMNQGLFWLLQSGGEETDYEEYLINVFDLFQIHLKNVFDMDSIVVVCPGRMLPRVQEEFHRLQGMLLPHMFAEGNLFTYEELKNVIRSRSLTENPEINPALLGRMAARIRTNLEAQDREGFFQEAEPIFEMLKGVKSRHSIRAKEIYLSLSLCLLEYIDQTGLYEQLPFEMPLAPLTNPDEYGDWAQAAAYLRRLSEAVFRNNEEKNDCKIDSIIARVEQMVEENLEKNMGLAQISQKLYFNSCYLSRLYKASRGINLSDYIAERKMERAKQLLAQPDIKVQSIGERMGYSSPANFIRSFRKHFGMTPNEYRRTIAQ